MHSEDHFSEEGLCRSRFPWQVYASWKLGSTCNSVWPGLACTCADLRSLWLRSFCNQVKASFSPFGHPSQLNTSWVTSISQWNIGNVCFEMGLFVTSVYLRGNLRVRLATQRKSVRKFNLRPLATTCRSVWPGLKRKWKVRVPSHASVSKY